MLSTRLTFLAAAVLVLIGTAAHAADYPPPVYTQPEPQPIIVQAVPAPVVDCCDGWYLRGHVGVGMMGEFELATSPSPPGRYVSKSVDDTFFVGGGVGYNWNSWLRLEGTAEYRARAQLSALGRFNGGPGTYLDQMDGYLKSWVFLANAFVDLGTWNCFTPFVGAGIGMAYHQMADFKDVTPLTPGGGVSSAYGVGRDTGKWSMAWALYAGVAYNITKSFTIDFTYRYLDLGSAREIIDCAGSSCSPSSFTHDFKNLASHDFMIGFRWACCDIPTPAPPVVYTPPPPPLQTRG